MTIFFFLLKEKKAAEILINDFQKTGTSKSERYWILFQHKLTLYIKVHIHIYGTKCGLRLLQPRYCRLPVSSTQSGHSPLASLIRTATDLMFFVFHTTRCKFQRLRSVKIPDHVLARQDQQILNKLNQPLIA